MPHKPNPRRVPATGADVNKARAEGRVEGAEFAITVLLFVLRDKHGGSPEEIKQLAREFSFYIHQIDSGEIKYADVKRALNTEFDVTVRMQ